MKLLMLGSTGYHPNETRHTLCLMIPELGIVLDAGSGMFRVREHLLAGSLDIFLSHAHLDHVFGLTFLFDLLVDRDIERVRVHALPNILDAVKTHLLAPAIFPVPLPCEYVPLVDRFDLPRGGVLSHFPLVHPGGSTGYRLDWPDRSLAYVTDTTASLDAPYLEHIQGVDVLIHECYFPDSLRRLALKTGHSHTSPVCQIAREAKVGRLILVHMNPLVSEFDSIGLELARSIFPATEIGYDGMEIDF